MKKTIIALAVLALAGCTVFENRIACALAKDEAFFVSKYGQFGITSTIAEQDTKLICPK